LVNAPFTFNLLNVKQGTKFILFRRITNRIIYCTYHTYLPTDAIFLQFIIV